jgi:hypothetical protein
MEKNKIAVMNEMTNIGLKKIFKIEMIKNLPLKFRKQILRFCNFPVKFGSFKFQQNKSKSQLEVWIIWISSSLNNHHKKVNKNTQSKHSV